MFQDFSSANPLVTVVIAVRNGGEFLSKTLWSVRRQTFENIEVIVVDDGSTDDTAQIAFRHGAEDDRIRVVQIAPGGVAAARNLGILQAQGDLVTLVDGDDLIHSDLLSSHVARFLQGPNSVAAVFSLGVNIDEDDVVGNLLLPFGRSTMRSLEGWVLLPMIYRYFPSPSSTTYRRECMLELGGYDVHLPFAEDYELMLRFVERWKIGFVDRPLMGYRYVPSSRSARATLKLRGQKSILRNFKKRCPWIPRYVWRWSLAGVYKNASWKSLQTKHRARAIQYGIAALCLDPILLLEPAMLPRLYSYLLTGRASQENRIVTFPDGLDRLDDHTSTVQFKLYAWIEQRRNRRMFDAEYRARGEIEGHGRW
jgi:glycosyltransferase involved in cell wall biosynthesis